MEEAETFVSSHNSSPVRLEDHRTEHQATIRATLGASSILLNDCERLVLRGTTMIPTQAKRRPQCSDSLDHTTLYSYTFVPASSPASFVARVGTAAERWHHVVAKGGGTTVVKGVSNLNCVAGPGISDGCFFDQI